MDRATQLRNLKKSQNEARAKRARVITVTSGKGGVGKSNVAINLAIQFKKLGQRVIILDADLGLANIEIMFGTVPKHNLSDLIYQGRNIREIITQGPMDVGFISGGSGITRMSRLDRDNLSYIVMNLAELDSIADTVIIDTGAGIADSVMEFLVASGEIILVTTPEPTSITDSYSLLKALTRHPRFRREETQIRVVANQVSGDNEGQILFNKLNAVVVRFLKLQLTYLGAVPHDQALANAVMQQKPVSLHNPTAKSTRAFERIAGQLTDNEQLKNANSRGMAAFFSHILGGSR